MQEEVYGIGQSVSYRDDNGELNDGWIVNAYDATNLQYELVKGGRRIWIDDTRIV